MKNLERLARELGFQAKMKEIQILAIGPFNDIQLFYNDELQSFDEKTTEKINNTWQEHLQKRPDDFPRTLAHTLGIVQYKYNRILECHLQKTRYDIFLGTREPGKLRFLPKNKLWEENYSLPLSFGAVTITSDNAIICGIRGKSGLESGMLTTLPSGYLNPEAHVVYDAMGRKIPSFLVLVAAELKKELNLDLYESIKILGVAQDCAGSQQPSIYIRLRVPFNSNEVQQKAEEAEKEIEKLVFLSNTIMSIRRVQQENYQWTGHDYGKLMFHFALPE